MFIKILVCSTLVLLLLETVRSEAELTESVNPGLFRKVFIIGKCKPGARLIKEKQILTPTKSDADGTLTAYFKFYNIGNISITCVHLIITTDTDEIKYRISSGGIGHDYVNFSVEGSNGNVMMSRAVVYGI